MTHPPRCLGCGRLFRRKVTHRAHGFCCRCYLSRLRAGEFNRGFVTIPTPADPVDMGKLIEVVSEPEGKKREST